MKKLIMVALIATSTHSTAAEYLVKLKKGHSFSNKSVAITSNFDLSYGQFVVIDTDEKKVENLQKLDEVEYIEPNHIYTISNIKDTDYKKQWGLKNTGRNSGSIFFPGKKNTDINAQNAWKITTGSKDVKIAVIDTGVDYTHDDLKNNILINKLELNGTEGVDDDGNGYIDDVYGYDFANNDSDPMDGHGHGTHCAGVIGASHNKIGIRGVMANVKILPIQFLTKSGRGTLEGAVKSIDYAIQRGVQIMSNSWGGAGESVALTEAVQRAQKAGILFVAAAGNEKNDNDLRPKIPANIKFDNVISVGAMDGKGKKASFSNYGKKTVHVFAPGVDIYSTVIENKYKKMSGTSMACPFISGIAGLLLASEPNLTYKELKSRIMTHVNPGEQLSEYSLSGFTDAYKALKN
ncbi:MAG: S8 family serine peptidase [Bacteriovoracaceae bacterium]|nr:S8 family serine peptidase [Bacteriovoracaceae bacterium]